MKYSKIQNQHKLQQKKYVRVGLAVTKKKLQYKKYRQTFNLVKSEEIQVIELWPYFQQHWSNWPVVDVILGFHSVGFPYVMVRQYVSKYNPLVINDLDNQQLLWDRTAIYDVLQDIQVPIPNHIRVCRDNDYINKIQEKNFGKIYSRNNEEVSYNDYIKGNQNKPKTLRRLLQRRKNKSMQFEVVQESDYIIFKNKNQQFRYMKPFLQKSFESGDHRVAVYYPQQLGGGRRVLFRQNHGTSSSIQSQYQSSQSFIRKDKNYIYQQFLPTNAYEIKVYAVGEFIFAQSRRSPIVDVQKKQNVQIRHLVNLTSQQKFLCKKIQKKFGQQICGFDILRSNNKSYICDINGWQFASAQFLKEKIQDYWQICANMMKNKIYERYFPQKVIQMNYQTYDQYLIKIDQHPASFCVKDNPNQQTLKHVISIYNFNKNYSPFKSYKKQQLNNRLTQTLNKLGQKIRLQRYQDINCLQLHSKYEHQLLIECQQEINKLLIAYFLKGFLNIQNQVSPCLVKMVKISQKYGYSPVTKGHSYSEQWLKLIDGLIKQIKQQQQIKHQLKTSIYFKSQPQLNSILDYIKQKIKQYPSFFNRNIKQKIDSIEEISFLSNIEIRIFEREGQNENETEKQQLNISQYKLQISIFLRKNILQNQKIENQITFSFSIQENQFKQLLNTKLNKNQKDNPEEIKVIS